MISDKNSGYPGSTLVRLLAESAQRNHAAHDHFLQHRRAGMDDLRSIIELQIKAVQPRPASHDAPTLFDSAQLDAFGAGRFSDCLGEAFRKYDGRRIPRIPNGDLKMMSRVVAIEGTPRDFKQPASVTAAYDVPMDAWYLRDNPSGEIPYALWMEIALQPCGFLSAYLDSYALVDSDEFFFRNLDGSACLKAVGDVRGQTLTTRARLLSSATSGGTVIQQFDFTVMGGGQVLFEGESTFGYFIAKKMAAQVGLDGGKKVQPWLVSSGGPGSRVGTLDAGRYRGGAPGQVPLPLARGRLAIIKQASVDVDGGAHGRGYLYASQPIDPQNWYFPYHFTDDPVMPGSLGVEAVLEGVKVLALAKGLENGFRAPRFALASETCTSWRYRGQITPEHRRMELEVHLREATQNEAGLTLFADASVWIDGLRIYEVKNALVRMME